MSLPRFSVRNPVLVNMMMIVILFGGAILSLTLVKEMFPESRPNKLLITVMHPGVQPQEIEKAVTIKIEEAVRDVDGIEKVESTVQESVSITVLTLFNEVKDVDAVLQEVKNKVDALQDLPDDVEQVSIAKLEPRLPVISVAIFGEGGESERKRAARQLRDRLLLLPGVTDVEVTGTRDDEISVDVRPGQLKKYNLTFDEIAAAIRATNLDVSGGQLKGDRARVSVRTVGEKLRGRDIENVVVQKRSDGSKVFLHQVADVRDTFVESDLESFFNGEPAVNCVVYKSGRQDAVQIANVVRAYVAGKQNADFDPFGFNEAYAQPWYWKPFALAGSGLDAFTSKFAAGLSGESHPMQVYEESLNDPFDHNFQVALHTNLARFIEGRLDLLMRNGKSGLVLVVVSLLLFLNWRVAFWAAIGLPVSFLGTFIVMWMMGVSMNLLSMFGLIIVLGIIVDDAIVIGENIFRHVEEGEPPMLAAVRGAEEVMWPVTIAVTTTIAAFAPLFFIKGQVGDFMGQLPIVVLAALSVSLLEALIILPAHLRHLPRRSKLLQEKPPETAFAKAWGGLRSVQRRVIGGRLGGAYEGFLRLALKWRYVTLASAVALLMIAGGLVAGQVVEFVFIQKMDGETLICSLEMPVGTPANEVRDRVNKLTRLATDMPEVSNVQSFVARQYDLSGAGATGVNTQTHLGQLVLELRPSDARELDGQRSSMELLTVFRQASDRLAGVNSVSWEAMSGGPGGKDVHIKISGAEFEELTAVADEIRDVLKGTAGVFDIEDNVDRGQREMQLAVRSGAREAGIDESTLGTTVRSAIFGREALRLTRNREDVKIMVRYPRRFRKSMHQIEELPLPVVKEDEGLWHWTELKNVADVKETESYASIHRSQQTRSVTVLAEVDQESGTKTQDVLAAVRTAFDEEVSKRHPQVRLEFLGQAEEMRKSFSGLSIAFPVALLLIFMLLAGLFRSYFQPMVVMSAIPFAVLGAVIGHWVTGYPITILSLIGMVALMGIVVNDSLVLVDFINNRIRGGMEPFEASIQGAKLRLRAILLTTLTTVAGLTPLMFETSFQAKFLIPMAVTLTWGLAFATLLTLILVPCLNMIFFDLRGWFQPAAVGVPKDPFEEFEAAQAEYADGRDIPDHHQPDADLPGNGHPDAGATIPAPQTPPAKTSPSG